MPFDDDTYARRALPVAMPSGALAPRVAGAGADARQLRVFLISNFQLLLESMAQTIRSQPQHYHLQGCALAANTQAPWGSEAPDVVLLDLDTEPQRALQWLKAWRHQGGAPRVLLFSRLDQSPLIDEAILEGGGGLIGPEVSPEQFLRALEKVAQGEVWLNQATTTRLLHGQAKQAAASPHDPYKLVKAKLSLLTDKELHILSKLLHHGGESAKAIAGRLFISESTLRNHLTSIYEKMGVRNRNGLIAQASQIGLAEHLTPSRPTLTPHPGKGDN